MTGTAGFIGLGLMGGPMEGRGEDDWTAFTVAALEDAGLSQAKTG
ncbi:MAG TPA: hypothetical protein VMP00_09220 [Burkholderiales bacterium]|nr:hypothetical protein [Burkholderiales bacterium]